MSRFERDHKSTTSADRHYLSSKEIKEIAKANAHVMKALEKKKHRKADESEFVTEMKDNRNILEIDNLHTYFFTDQGVVKAVNGVSFSIPKGATVGIVGESGCGKSVTSMSVMRLLQGPQGQIYSGSIRFKAYDYKRDEFGNPIPAFKRKKNGKEAIIRFSKWTLTHEMVADTVVGDASFAEYIKRCYPKQP
jgi:peptide/nickel transport system ATP-binding protein